LFFGGFTFIHILVVPKLRLKERQCREKNSQGVSIKIARRVLCDNSGQTLKYSAKQVLGYPFVNELLMIFNQRSLDSPKMRKKIKN